MSHTAVATHAPVTAAKDWSLNPRDRKRLALLLIALLLLGALVILQYQAARFIVDLFPGQARATGVVPGGRGTVMSSAGLPTRSPVQRSVRNGANIVLPRSGSQNVDAFGADSQLNEAAAIPLDFQTISQLLERAGHGAVFPDDLVSTVPSGFLGNQFYNWGSSFNAANTNSDASSDNSSHNSYSAGINGTNNSLAPADIGSDSVGPSDNGAPDSSHSGSPNSPNADSFEQTLDEIPNSNVQAPGEQETNNGLEEYPISYGSIPNTPDDHSDGILENSDLAYPNEPVDVPEPITVHLFAGALLLLLMRMSSTFRYRTAKGRT